MPSAGPEQAKLRLCHEETSMKKLLTLLLAFLLAITFSGCSAAKEGFNRGLVSVTFDDGWASQHVNGLPVLEKYGIPATWYIVSGYVDNAPDYMTQSQIRALIKRGDEIASHTVTHAHLPQLAPNQLNAELKGSQAALRRMFGPEVAKGFASPYGEYNDTTLAAIKRYYSTQRAFHDGVTDVGFNTLGNFDPYTVRVQWVDSTTPRATIQDWLDTAEAENSWLVIVYHEIGTSVGQDIFNTPTADLEAEMKAVANSNLGVVTVKEAVQEITEQMR
jgi:peptidoglycan/xylan/chitin deacetylase (PgdA/CDA1 family)